MAVTAIRACRSASLPASSCFLAASSRTRLRFLAERSSMAAARALPTSGATAGVGGEDVGAALEVVVDGRGASADVVVGVLAPVVGNVAVAPTPCVQPARTTTAAADTTRSRTRWRAVWTLVVVTVSSFVLVMVQLTGRSCGWRGAKPAPAPPRGL